MAQFPALILPGPSRSDSDIVRYGDVLAGSLRGEYNLAHPLMRGAVRAYNFMKNSGGWSQPYFEPVQNTSLSGSFNISSGGIIRIGPETRRANYINGYQWFADQSTYQSKIQATQQLTAFTEIWPISISPAGDSACVFGNCPNGGTYNWLFYMATSGNLAWYVRVGASTIATISTAVHAINSAGSQWIRLVGTWDGQTMGFVIYSQNRGVLFSEYRSPPSQQGNIYNANVVTMWGVWSTHGLNYAHSNSIIWNRFMHQDEAHELARNPYQVYYNTKHRKLYSIPAVDRMGIYTVRRRM